MTFGITPQGFNRPLESDIRALLVADIAPQFGVDPSTTDWPDTNSVVSQLLEPFCRQLGLVWEQVEAAFQATDPAQAFGTLLDGLLALNNLARNEAQATAVLAAISGTEGAVVPAGTRLSVLSTAALFAARAGATITKAALLRYNVQVASASSIGTQYVVTLNAHAVLSGTLTGSPSRDYIALRLLNAINADTVVNAAVQAVLYGSAVIQIGTVSNSSGYTVTLNGIACLYTSDSSATSQEIVDGLVAAINAGQGDLIALGLSSATFSLTHRVPGTDWNLVLNGGLLVAGLTPTGAFAVKSANLKTAFAGDVDSRMAIDKLFSPQYYDAVATGPIPVPAGTLVNIESQVTGLSAATNFLDGVLGKDVEADDAARIRREQTLSTGAGHTAAIISQIQRNVPNVSVVRAYENYMDTADADGRPGHSVEVLAQGGDDLLVASAIWATRAAGIVPYGNINADGSVALSGSGTGITVSDSNGLPQVVHYSRPQPKYAWVTVVKTLYSEEDYPAQGDEAIRQAVLAYGDSLGIGKDFLLQRFIGPCVSIPGVGSVDLRIAVSDDPDNPPVGYPTSGTPTGQDWRANIAISARQLLVFDTTRIAVS